MVLATACDRGGVQKYHHHWNVQPINGKWVLGTWPRLLQNHAILKIQAGSVNSN